METAAYILEFRLPGYGTVRVFVVGTEDNITALELSLPPGNDAKTHLYDTEACQNVPSSSHLWPIYHKAMASVTDGTLPNSPEPGSMPRGESPGEADKAG